eukprot:COSAG01_NODE_43318_length_431_cov_0.581325_1_plen_22_part_10
MGQCDQKALLVIPQAGRIAPER